jgi:hypothetical protein
MKTLIAALALVLIAAGPTFAAGSPSFGITYQQVSQFGHYARFADAVSTNQFTSREGLVSAALDTLLQAGRATDLPPIIEARRD